MESQKKNSLEETTGGSDLFERPAQNPANLKVRSDYSVSYLVIF